MADFDLIRFSAMVNDLLVHDAYSRKTNANMQARKERLLPSHSNGSSAPWNKSLNS
jgi:hypothetical protein